MAAAVAALEPGIGRGWGGAATNLGQVGVFLPPLFQFSLPVADLAQFAQQGTVSRQLDSYLRHLTLEQQAALADQSSKAVGGSARLVWCLPSILWCGPVCSSQMGQSLSGRDPHLGLFWT